MTVTTRWELIVAIDDYICFTPPHDSVSRICLYTFTSCRASDNERNDLISCVAKHSYFPISPRLNTKIANNMGWIKQSVQHNKIINNLRKSLACICLPPCFVLCTVSQNWPSNNSFQQKKPDYIKLSPNTNKNYRLQLVQVSNRSQRYFQFGDLVHFERPVQHLDNRSRQFEVLLLSR